MPFSGNHDILMPRLLAHEIAHLLGSDHDGDAPKSVFLLLILSFFPLSILAILVGFEYLIMMMALFSRTAIKGSSSFWYLLTHGERFQPMRVLVKHGNDIPNGITQDS